MLRTPITLTATALAGVLMLSACGSVKLGAAAVSNNQRISSATVTDEVNNLNQAYQADKAKIQLQFAAAQMPQEVLSWLLRFQVREQMANRYGIHGDPDPGAGRAHLHFRAGQAERRHRAGPGCR